MRRPISAERLAEFRRDALGGTHEVSLDLVDEPAPSRPRKPSGKRGLQNAVDDAIARVQRSQDPNEDHAWDDAEAKTLVGLYAWLHTEVYGVPPAELEKEFLAACSAARSLLEKDFEDDAGSAVLYLRWAFAREKRTERWRVENNRQGRRIGWRLVFASRSLLTDYRVEGNRFGKRRKESK